MRVEKFTKLKNGMYKLHLEDGSNVMAYEDLILKRDILLKREISDEDLSNIDKLNNNYNAYDIAIKYISTKYRSIYETETYLSKKEIDKDVINDVISRLKEQKYLDDKVFAKAFINDRLKFSNYGPYKIKRELEEVKVAPNIVDEVLSIFDVEVERERLSKLVPKYVKTIHNKSYVMMKNKVINYFSSLGYNRSIIEEFLGDIQYDDSASREKEYQKLHKKLSKKYSGSELELKIKEAMYRNGYR